MWMFLRKVLCLVRWLRSTCKFSRDCRIEKLVCAINRRERCVQDECTAEGEMGEWEQREEGRRSDRVWTSFL